MSVISGGGSPRLRLGVLANHPVQYYAPLFRQLARSDSLSLTVVYFNDFGVRPSFDPDYGITVRFDVPLTEGYDHVFVRERADRLAGPGWVPPLSLLMPLLTRSFDAVLVPGYTSLASIGACAAARAVRMPYVMRAATSMFTELRQPALRSKAKRAALGPLLRGAGACAAIGRTNSDFYRHYGVPEARIVMAPNAVDTEFFAAAAGTSDEDKAARLVDVGLDPRLPVALFVGRLTAIKRPADFVDAVRRMRTAANVLVIGEGPLRAALEPAVARLKNGRVLGFVNQSELRSWYGSADAIVLPSSYEPWGLVVNEAMSAGAIPIVSDAVGCGPDLVREGCGAVYPVGDVARLAQALDGILSPNVDRATMKASARTLMRDEYSLCRTAAGIEQAARVAVGEPVASCESLGDR